MSLLMSEKEATGAIADIDFERFAIDLPGRIFMTGHHFHISDAVCAISDISCGGALLKVSPDTAISTHFFLQIKGMRDEIGCTMVSRTLELISTNFNMLLNEDFLHAILKRNAISEAGLTDH
jgi:hypothetical protein